MYNSIPKQFEIYDNRKSKDFDKKTFNGYKKSDIFKELLKNILSGNIEKSILWVTELHCSGYTNIIYHKLFNLFTKEINKANLTIINLFINDFTLIKKKNEFYDNYIDLRNDQCIRNHITNIVCILTFSPKSKLEKLPNINSEDFNMVNNVKRIISKNLNDIQIFIKKNDPKNLIIPLSEILLNLKKTGISKSIENLLFWLNWIIVYEKNYHNGYIKCHTRNIDNVEPKFLNDFSWIIWEILLKVSNSIYIYKLYNLYKLNFTKSKKKTKIDLIIIAFDIIINPFPYIDFDKNILNYTQNLIRNKIIANINYQYYDINFNNSPNILEKKLNQFPIINNKLTIQNPIFSKTSFVQEKNTIEYLDKFGNQSKKTTNFNKFNDNIEKINIIYNTSIEKLSNSPDSNINLEDYIIEKKNQTNKIPKCKNDINHKFSLKNTIKKIDKQLL